MMQVFTKWVLCFFIILFVGLAPALAQIQAKSIERQKKEQKRFLKEAERTESDYKATHLNTSAYTFKRGEAARKRVSKRDERRQYKFDEAGNPQKKKTIFRKKATKKQAGG
ncbi:hypothetical protein [Pontibacter fetidus]|uniref:Uncharacterized protein n=1 Tax=Pontibacter fetidus TaxID=2700082 RepID=A0A6B2H3L6_9BACT|nr:hypothetical protein [Pontibacter fetidus]NDK56943.1 hypothetical protein [Pontibacter fetidus]